MSRKKEILEQIAALEESKELAIDNCDFRTFSLLCQDVRDLERQLRQLEYEENLACELIRLDDQ